MGKTLGRRLSWALISVIGLVGLAVSLPKTNAGEESRPELRTLSGAEVTPKVRARVRVGPPPVGTIQFDNNVPFNRNGQSGGLIGNRFAAPAVQDPHTFASASFRMANAYGGTATALILDINTGAGTVSTIDMAGATGISSGTTATHVVPLAGGSHSGSFIGGMLQTAYAACAGLTGINSGLTCEGVALTQGGLTGGPGDPGEGFNAVAVTSTANTGVPIANQNAIFRITGQNLPVELMNFSID
ncbi:MAG: hypothetical protein K0U98_18590 [Deltaproteobacteria bacterium]|nr:hypothetical protein [Deltaproteobacteria bacterium]